MKRPNPADYDFNDEIDGAVFAKAMIEYCDHLEHRLDELQKKSKNETTSNVGCNTSFKEQMKQDVIPRVWRMVKKEREHLNWLIDNNAPQEMIETSRKCLSHYIQRYKQYSKYVLCYS